MSRRGSASITPSAVMPPYGSALPGRRIEVNPAAIPAELIERPQWGTWIWEKRGDDWTKPPYNPRTTRNAKPNDAGTWDTFSEALGAYEKHPEVAGVGFLFTAGDPFLGVDLDDCRNPDAGELVQWARDIVGRLGSYTEVSPSGTGVKIWIRAHMPGDSHRRSCQDGHIEIYDRGRYFTVTGWHVDGTPDRIEERQPELDELYNEYFTCSRKPAGNPRPRRSVVLQPDHNAGSPGDRPPDSLLEAVSAKIEDLRRRNQQFDLTWNHDRPELTDQSNSGYDLSLANMAYQEGWTDDEIEQLLLMHRRNVGADPRKHDWGDYFQRTLAKARETGMRPGGHFTRIADIVIDVFFPQLSHPAQVVYVVLARYRNAQGICYPSLATLADDSGYTRKTVARAISQLEAYGLVEKRLRPSSSGDYDTNEYRLLAVPTVTGSVGVPLPGGGSTHKVIHRKEGGKREKRTARPH